MFEQQPESFSLPASRNAPGPGRGPTPSRPEQPRESPTTLPDICDDDWARDDSSSRGPKPIEHDDPSVEDVERDTIPAPPPVEDGSSPQSGRLLERPGSSGGR